MQEFVDTISNVATTITPDPPDPAPPGGGGKRKARATRHSTWDSTVAVVPVAHAGTTTTDDNNYRATDFPKDRAIKRAK